MIISGGGERTRGVEGVRIGIDVEVALHLSRHHVHVLSQCARGFLLAVRAASDDVDGEIVEDMVRHVHVGGVAVHLAVNVPARVHHGRERRIVVALLRTATQTDGVVLHDGRREKLLKPVGVTVFGLLQVGILCLLGVGKSEAASCGVVGIDEFVHLAVHTVVGAVENVGEVEPSLVLQLLVDTHLVLRVEDVEIAVRGNKTGGKLARIVDMGLSGLSFLGSDNDNARHSARTINRSGTTVFQYLETLDVVGVESCNGRTDKGLGIARCQVVGTHVRHVFHDDTINNPEGFAATIDGGSTANTNLRCRTKRTAHVLY